MDGDLQWTPTTFIASFILSFISSLNCNLQSRFYPRCFVTKASFTLDLLKKSGGWVTVIFLRNKTPCMCLLLLCLNEIFYWYAQQVNIRVLNQKYSINNNREKQRKTILCFSLLLFIEYFCKKLSIRFLSFR